MELPGGKTPWLVGGGVVAAAAVLALLHGRAPQPAEPGLVFDPRPDAVFDDEDLPPSNLLSLLASPAGAGAADIAVRAIMSDPKLQDRWAKLVAEKPGAAPGALISQMKDEDGFEGLLGRLKGDAAFRRQVELARVEGFGGGGAGSGAGFSASADPPRAGVPGGEGSVLSRGRSVGPGRAASKAPLTAGRGARSAVGQDLRGRVGPGGAGAGGALAASAGPAAYGSSAAQRSGLGASGSAAGNADAGGAPSGPGGGPSAGGPGGAGSGANDVNPGLAAPADPVSERMRKLLDQYPFLRSLSEAELRRLVESDDVSRFGLWGACFHLGMYDRCAAVCRAAPDCVLKKPWDSCLEYKNGNSDACLDLCAQLRGCVPPPDVPCRRCNGVVQGNACALNNTCEHPRDRFQGFYDCLKRYGGHSCSGTKQCKNCCGPPGGGPGPGHDVFTIWCELPGEGGGRRGTPGLQAACPYAGKTCEQLCSSFRQAGSCGGNCVRWERSCPSDSACDVSVRQDPGEPGRSSSTPCR
ncbi:MAG: hypothetical protein HY553_11710 [Elusimicrobia bacterium]|nr:hypothetical protein [Elusimicrobiota bacterium]